MYLFYQYTPYLIIILCHFIFDIFYIRIISVETRILKKNFLRIRKLETAIVIESQDSIKLLLSEY